MTHEAIPSLAALWPQSYEPLKAAHLVHCHHKSPYDSRNITLLSHTMETLAGMAKSSMHAPELLGNSTSAGKFATAKMSTCQ